MRTLALVLLTLLATPSLAFDLEGHRGTRGLAPENTLAAFRRALDIGVATIETDLGMTKDGVVVISPGWSLPWCARRMSPIA
jgi:glycerophosphoryl diester phosphodiesterase